MNGCISIFTGHLQYYNYYVYISAANYSGFVPRRKTMKYTTTLTFNTSESSGFLKLNQWILKF